MAQEIKMPALGESVTEGTITVWLKQVGDVVALDEPIVEVSTDKVDTEVPSPVAGIITEILVGEDETVDVGTVLALVGDEAESAESPSSHEAGSDESASAPAPAPASAPTPAPTSSPMPENDLVSLVMPAPLSAMPASSSCASTASEAAGNPADDDAPNTPAHPAEDSAIDLTSADYISPIVRKLAKDLNVDLTDVTGTGIGGRIRRQDVKAAAEAAARTAQSSVAAAGAAAPLPPARALTHTAQYPTLIAHIRATSLPEDYVPAVLHVIAQALTEYSALSLGASPALGVTLAGKRGAFMPVLRNFENLEPSAIRAAVDDVTARSAVGTIGPDDLFGSTISVVDNSSHDVLFEIPAIQPSHCAAISIGAREAHVFCTPDGSLFAAPAFYLSLTYNPAAADAHIAASFLSAVKTRIEQ